MTQSNDPDRREPQGADMMNKSFGTDNKADDVIFLERLVPARRQRRPQTGDVFRVRIVSGEYYFGLVVDGDMAVGPLAPGSILVVVFECCSKSGQFSDVDEIVNRPLLMPPAIVNQRPWTLGYAEKVGSTDKQPDIHYVFDDLVFGGLVDRHGQKVRQRQSDLAGVWGLGNEKTLEDKIENALR